MIRQLESPPGSGGLDELPFGQGQDFAAHHPGDGGHVDQSHRQNHRQQAFPEAPGEQHGHQDEGESPDEVHHSAEGTVGPTPPEAGHGADGQPGQQRQAGDPHRHRQAHPDGDEQSGGGVAAQMVGTQQGVLAEGDGMDVGEVDEFVVATHDDGARQAGAHHQHSENHPGEQETVADQVPHPPPEDRDVLALFEIQEPLFPFGEIGLGCRGSHYRVSVKVGTRRRRPWGARRESRLV